MSTDLHTALDKADDKTHDLAFTFYRQLIKDSIPPSSASKLTLAKFFNYTN